jgi:hypothetical protein
MICKTCGAQKVLHYKGLRDGQPKQAYACMPCQRRRIAESGKKTAYNARWNKLNPEKRRAHKIVEGALIRGDIERKPCAVCGSDKSQAHHDDYSKPLDVMWICAPHHRQRHRELKDMTRVAS